MEFQNPKGIIGIQKVEGNKQNFKKLKGITKN